MEGDVAKAHFLAASDLSLALHRHVGNSGEVFRDDRRELETRAETRLIPAGKHPARIGRLKLRPEHDLLFVSSLLLIARVEQSLPLGVDFSAEGERQFVVPRRQLVRQIER